jgi:hypothetical protein
MELGSLQRDHLYAKNATLRAQLYGANSTESMTSYLLDADGILTTPGYKFSLTGFRIFSHTESINIDLYLDFSASHSLSSEPYLKIHSEQRQVLGPMPPYAQNSYIAFRDEQRLNLTFVRPIPISDIVVNGVTLSSATDNRTIELNLVKVSEDRLSAVVAASALSSFPVGEYRAQL